MAKYKNISADELMVLVDAGRKASNGEPYAWWKIMQPDEILEFSNEAIRGASVNPKLRLITEEKPELIAPTITHEIKDKQEVQPKRRGRPPKTI